MENTKITIESELFTSLRASFDKVLNSMLKYMQDTGARQSEMTLKLNIDLYDSKSTDEEIKYIPLIKHKASAVCKAKAEESGKTDGKFDLVFNAETGEFEICKNDEQVSFDEFDDEEAEDDD